MKELEPLAQASNNPRTRALLQAGQGETPPADFANKLMLGLGVAGATASVSLGAAASVGAAGTAKIGAGTVGSGAASWLLAAKWVAVGMVGGGILASGASAVLSPTQARSVAPLATDSAQPARSSPVRAPALPVVSTEAVPTVAEPAVAEPAKAEPAGKPAEKAPVSAPPSATSGQLGREVMQMDRARAAFTGGDAARTLAELDTFDRLAQTGVLDREARVLRIEALQRLGRNAEARGLAERYLGLYPNDAHAQRLRTFVGEGR